MSDENTSALGGDGVTGDNDLSLRTKHFIEQYGELVKKFKIDFASYPEFQPDGHGGFSVVIRSVPLDVSDRPEPSPFMQK